MTSFTVKYKPYFLRKAKALNMESVTVTAWINGADYEEGDNISILISVRQYALANSTARCFAALLGF